MSEHTTRIGDRSIRYLEEGSGEPMILLHGASIGSSADSFARNLRALAHAGFRTISVDRPGYGGSDGPQEVTGSGHASFILRFMDALQLEQAILVGHSQQASVVAQLALDHADRVPRAITVGGGVLPPLGADGRRGEGLTGEPTLEWTRQQLGENLYNHDLITPEEVTLRHRLSVGRNYEYHANRPSAPREASNGDPVSKRVGEHPERILILVGRNDSQNMSERIDLGRRQYPNLNLVAYDSCAHLVHWDQQADFERQVIAFARAAAAVA